MFTSTYLLPLKFQDQILLLNGLSGHVDLLREDFWQKLQKSKNNGNFDWLSPNLRQKLLKRQYLFTDKGQEKKIIRQMVNKWQKSAGKTLAVTINFSEACNLACPYCINKTRRNSLQMTTNQLDQIWKTLALLKQDGYKITNEITLFGGEPLRLENYKLVDYFLQKAKQNKCKIFVITNGVTIDKYLYLLKKYKRLINGFQITLDGPAEIHDQRRIGKDYPKTFDLISKNIDLLLKNKFSVSLRSNIDRQNLLSLPQLAQYIINKKWPKNPFFKAYLALVINNRPEACNQGPQAERMKFIKEFKRLSLANPAIKKVYKEDPFYDNACQFLFNALNKKPNTRKFAYCMSSGNNSLTFAADGSIYACMASVGIDSFRLATYFPKFAWDSVNWKRWRNRLPTKMQKCRKCPLVFICAGNCALDAYEQNRDIYSPVCTRALENLQEFVAIYQDKIGQLLKPKTSSVKN